MNPATDEQIALIDKKGLAWVVGGVNDDAKANDIGNALIARIKQEQELREVAITCSRDWRRRAETLEAESHENRKRAESAEARAERMAEALREIASRSNQRAAYQIARAALANPE